jgi:hypothetical protein
MLGDTGQVDGDNPGAHQGIGLFYVAKTTLIGKTRQINTFNNSVCEMTHCANKAQRSLDQ